MTKFLTLGLFAFLVSCSETVKEKDLFGKWAMRNDTIEIKKDGTFIHYFSGRNNSGKWKLNSSGNEIDFDGFSFSPETNGGHWYSRISRKGNEIHLVYTSDTSDGYYRKISDSTNVR